MNSQIELSLNPAPVVSNLTNVKNEERRIYERAVTLAGGAVYIACTQNTVEDLRTNRHAIERRTLVKGWVRVEMVTPGQNLCYSWFFCDSESLKIFFFMSAAKTCL